jgi:gas vesicle protein
MRKTIIAQKLVNDLEELFGLPVEFIFGKYSFPNNTEVVETNDAIDRVRIIFNALPRPGYPTFSTPETWTYFLGDKSIFISKTKCFLSTERAGSSSVVYDNNASNLFYTINNDFYFCIFSEDLDMKTAVEITRSSAERIKEKIISIRKVDAKLLKSTLEKNFVSQISKYKSAIIQNNSLINSQNQNLVDYHHQLNENIKLLENAEKAKKEIMPEAEKRAKEINNLVPKMYKKIYYDGTNLVAITNQIIVGFGDKYYDLGEFTVKIDLSNNGITALSDKPLTHRYPHPHISQSGVFCLGEAAKEIPKLLASQQYDLVFQLLHSLINSYNPESPYIHLEEFTELKEGKSRVVKTSRARTRRRIITRESAEAVVEPEITELEF